MTLKNMIESVLFASGRFMSLDEITKLVEAEKDDVKKTVFELKESYSHENTALKLVDENDNYKLTIKEKYLNIVSLINTNAEMTKSMMETLAVIAWKQPILQSDVISTRTTKAYDHISDLETMQFISREKFGRSFILRTTAKFDEYFDLPENKNIKEVLDKFQDIGENQTKVDEFKTDELGNPLDLNSIESFEKEKIEIKPYFDDKKDGKSAFEKSDDKFESMLNADFTKSGEKQENLTDDDSFLDSVSSKLKEKSSKESDPNDLKASELTEEELALIQKLTQAQKEDEEEQNIEVEVNNHGGSSESGDNSSDENSFDSESTVDESTYETSKEK